jgi:dihydroorotase
VRTASDLAEKREYLRERSRVDYALGAHAWPNGDDRVAEVWRAGAAFLKAFTCTTHGIPGLTAAQLYALFEQAHGCGAVCLVHCEDESLTAEAEKVLRAAGHNDGGIVPAWRNRPAELTALAVTALLARITGARAVAAHVSHAAGIDLVERERASGADVLAETCPQYLSLFENEVVMHGAFRKFTPPARARDEGDLDAMWQAVADGRVAYVSSDHAPSTIEQKQAGSIWDVHFGVPGVDTTLSVLLDGAHAGRISFSRIAEVYSETPARIYGLWPRKGHLAEGADADVVVVDPAERWTIANEDIISKAGWSPLVGRTIVGRAVRTYLRGRLAAADGIVTAEPGTGEFVAGAGAPLH